MRERVNKICKDGAVATLLKYSPLSTSIMKELVHSLTEIHQNMKLGRVIEFDDTQKIGLITFV